MKRIFAVLAGMILMFGLTWAVELADFQPHMKKAGRGVKALKRQVKAQDGAGAAKSAKAVATHFETMHKLWAADNITDAADWSKEASAAASEVASKATSEDWAGAQSAVKTLGQTCRSCHKAHRGKKKDGDKVINFIK
jgi:hypothetical protein